MSKVRLDTLKGKRFAKGNCSASLPFIANKQGVLIHRPRRISIHQLTINHSPHIAIEYWCGNHCCGLNKFTFLDAPPEGAFVCTYCEQKAVEAGEKTSDELVGRHVHVGKIKAIQACCQEALGDE